MKLPAQLSRDHDPKELESFLKRADKILRPWLEEKMAATLTEEEQAHLSHPEVMFSLGKRRGFREVLKLLPEE